LNSKPLHELSREEWEALCDGCGRCCLHKLQDEESGEVFYTRVACRLLDLATGRCRHYGQRQLLVSDCVVLAPDTPVALQWLPHTCAYRLRAENKPLPPWHPLNNGREFGVLEPGISVNGFAVSEDALAKGKELEDFLIPWPE
jgi:uncharacterized cysteine cluster protein YcgN (CxxCxxCC family)